MKTEVISFRKEVQPGESQTIQERLKADGRVTQVNMRFYPGQERQLHVKPYILHKANRQEDIVTYATGTEMFFSGDNDTFQIPVSADFEYDDEFDVFVQNADSTYQYTVVVDVIVTYFEDEVIA